MSVTVLATRRLSQLIRMSERRHSINMQPASSLHDDKAMFDSESAKPENSEDVPYPLTREEANVFVKTVLEIPDSEAMIAEDRMKFLDRVAEQIKRKIPFTNIHHFLSLPLWEMDDRQQCQLMSSAQGGPCWIMNPFTKALLERFGYKAHHICGHNPGGRFQDSHISTVVEDVSYPGSLHLVEPGTRRPLCAAIPLDFESESPEYEFHYMTSKFFRDGDRIIWCAKASTVTPGDKYIMYDSNGKAWKQQLIYLLNETRNWHPYVELIQAFLRVWNVMPPFNGLVFFAYLNDDQIISILAFKNNTMQYIYSRDGTYQRASLSKSAVLRMIQRHFPQYSDEFLTQVSEIAPID